MQESYEIVRILHNLVRWAVLILGVIAAVRALAGWFGRRGWLPVDDRLGLFFTMSLDIQVLLGLLLYFVPSLITTANFSRLGDAMGNPSVRFFLVEHALLMLVAVVLAHIGRSRAKKAPNPIARHRAAAIFYTLAIILVIAGIPWDRLNPFR
ncbi:MAG: hypothetical protein GX579_19660 [Chloroflexi bacterium]|nr:hypothetical protein [Chloroflexota bacterium]